MKQRLSLVCALIACAAALAQQTASVSGTLQDPNDNAVIGTEGSVHMMNTAMQKEFTTPILSKGDFTFSGLPAGTYDLTVPMACCMYGTYSQKGVAVQAGQTLKLDLHLPWSVNLGTIGDDMVRLMNDMRAKTKNIEGPTPRMPDGKVDFSGMWAQVTQPEPPNPFSLKPWAAEIQKKIQERAKANSTILNPAAFCLPTSALQIAIMGQFKLIQTPTLMIHLTEFLTPGYRQIFMDGRGHPKEFNPAWEGHSIGKWEGDTLVVDSTGFNEITAGVGVHSEKLHVVERFQRPDLGHLQVDITVEGEEAYTGPWKRTVRATLVPQEEILEYVCAENNKPGGLSYAGGR
jgi:hypothetical protein